MLHFLFSVEFRLFIARKCFLVVSFHFVDFCVNAISNFLIQFLCECLALIIQIGVNLFGRQCLNFQRKMWRYAVFDICIGNKFSYIQQHWVCLRIFFSCNFYIMFILNSVFCFCFSCIFNNIFMLVFVGNRETREFVHVICRFL